jgi:hypothetical protein
MTILRSRATASLWKTWHCFTSLAADQRGQAMVEYSSLTFAILIGTGVMGVSIPFGPGHLTLVQQLYGALQVHVNSMWYSLSLALP